MRMLPQNSQRSWIPRTDRRISALLTKSLVFRVKFFDFLSINISGGKASADHLKYKG